MEYEESKQSNNHLKWLPCIIGFGTALLIAGFLFVSGGETSATARGAFTNIDVTYFTYVPVVLTVIVGIVLLVIAYIIRKDAPAITIFLVVCVILLQVIAYLCTKSTFEPTSLKSTIHTIHTK